MKLELCQYCKRIETYRKTNGIPKCAVCEILGITKKQERKLIIK